MNLSDEPSHAHSPFSQRVWIALEAKGLQYQYREEDPYKTNASQQLLEANPKGAVPAIRQGDWACAGSAVILEYVSIRLTTRQCILADYSAPPPPLLFPLQPAPFTDW